MRKLMLSLAVAFGIFLAAGKAYAPLVTVVDESAPQDESSDTDSDTVDFSDKDTEPATWSPSFQKQPAPATAQEPAED